MTRSVHRPALGVRFCAYRPVIFCVGIKGCCAVVGFSWARHDLVNDRHVQELAGTLVGPNQRHHLSSQIGIFAARLLHIGCSCNRIFDL